MKKLMTLMLGLTLAIGSVAVSFAQEEPKKEEEGKKKGKKEEERRAKEGPSLAFSFKRWQPRNAKRIAALVFSGYRRTGQSSHFLGVLQATLTSMP